MLRRGKQFPLFFCLFLLENTYMEKYKKLNKTTLEAIKEADEDMKNPSKGKTYTSVEELLKDIFTDDEVSAN